MSIPKIEQKINEDKKPEDRKDEGNKFKPTAWSVVLEMAKCIQESKRLQLTLRNNL